MIMFKIINSHQMLKCWAIWSTYMRENKYIYSVLPAITQDTRKVVEGLYVVLPNVQSKTVKGVIIREPQPISQNDNSFNFLVHGEINNWVPQTVMQMKTQKGLLISKDSMSSLIYNAKALSHFWLCIQYIINLFPHAFA